MVEKIYTLFFITFFINPWLLIVSFSSLKKEGFLVSQFENGRDAYESINYENPDLIVLDWDMPIMSGIELVEKID